MANEQAVMAIIRAYKPVFRNDHDKVAFVVNASFLASGYVLIAAGPPAFSDNALYSPSTDEVGIDRWNQLEDEYAFVYLNPNEGSKKVLVKCLAMDDKLLIDALSDGDSEPVHLEIKVGDYVGEGEGSNYSSQFKNLGKPVNRVEKELIAKLNGGSSTTYSSKQSSSFETRERHRENPTPIDVGGAEPRYPQPYSPGFVPPVGGSDLFPGPPPGTFPSRGGFGSGGGMFVGPDHPMFGGGIDGNPFIRGPPGRPSGVPPGARFDPYGPPDVPGFEPNRFVRNPPRPGGGTHPDLQHYGDGSDFI